MSLLRLLPAAAAAATLSTVGRRSRVGRRSLGSLPRAASSELRFGQLVKVIGPIANRLPLVVEELERLLECDRRRRIAGNGRIEDVQPVLVQVDGDVAPSHIRIDDRELLAGDEIDVVE